MRDCSWRTGLGTCFYDRRPEAERVAGLLREGRTVILVGPRNAGKSELARYVLRRVLRVDAVEVDGRVVAARGLIEALRRARGLDTTLLAEIAGRLVSAESRLGALIDAVVEVAKRLERRLYLLIDEFHLLGDVKVLEAVAKMVAFYPEYRDVRLLVTSSEGSIMTGDALARLLGYNVRFLVVGEMPEGDFAGLYGEYCGSAPCRLGLREFLEVVGALPGFLPEVATMEEGELRSWIRERRAHLRRVLGEYAVRMGVDLGSVAADAHRLLCGGVAADEPLLLVLAEHLVRGNIAYPVEVGTRYRPQLRIYCRLLEELASAGRERSV